MADMLNSLDTVSALADQSNFHTDRGHNSSNYTTNADGTPSCPSPRQAISTTYQPVISTGNVSVSTPFVSVSSKVDYFKMTTPQWMSWPMSQTMDPATVRRIMTPLHINTSFGNDYFSQYPHQGSVGAGDGLLKIATNVYSHKQSVEEPEHQVPSVTEQQPTSWPTMAVVPIISGRTVGVKRPASEEPVSEEFYLPKLKRRKGRTTFTKEQVDTMEAQFQTSMYLTTGARRELATELMLEDNQVKTWFQNRRMRWKRQHPQVHVRSGKHPASCRSRTQVVKPLQGPPSQTNQLIVPTPPLVGSTPSAVTGSIKTFSSDDRPLTYPMLPSSLYDHGLMAPSAALQEEFCPAQALYSVPIYHRCPTGFDFHPWISANAGGPLAGAHCATRHV